MGRSAAIFFFISHESGCNKSAHLESTPGPIRLLKTADRWQRETVVRRGVGDEALRRPLTPPFTSPTITGRDWHPVCEALIRVMAHIFRRRFLCGGEQRAS